MNRNGVPNELEKEVKNDKDGTQNDNLAFAHVATQLLQEGFVNIFYDVNKDILNSGSMNNIFFIIQYLKKNQDSKIELTGYADLNGDEIANHDLSNRRATKLQNFIVASGINNARVSIKGAGEDKNQVNQSKIGLGMARRVSINLIKN